MADTPFLRVIGGAEAEESAIPTYEESLAYQARLLGLWEQQQRVLGYTEASIALSSRNLDAFLKVADKCIWEVTTHDIDQFYDQLVGRGLAYSTRRKYQSNITTFLDYLRSRHAHDIWQRYRVAVPTVLDKFNRHTHRQDDREDAVIPPDPKCWSASGRASSSRWTRRGSLPRWHATMPCTKSWPWLACASMKR